MYYNGVLNKDSLKALSRNPIHCLHLFNVAIEDPKAFIQFLNGNTHLTKIIIRGGKNIRAQQIILSEEFTDKAGIEKLELTVQGRLSKHYKALAEFKGLTRIILRLKHAKLFQEFFPHLENLPNLKNIVLRPSRTTNYENDIETVKMITKYQEILFMKGIMLDIKSQDYTSLAYTTAILN